MHRPQKAIIIKIKDSGKIQTVLIMMKNLIYSIFL